MPASARMLMNHSGKTLILCAKPQTLDLIRRGERVEISALPLGKDGHLDLEAALGLLAARGITRLMVEAGPTLAAAFAKAGLIDEWVLFTAPEKSGTGLRAIEPPLAEWQAKVHLIESRAVGPDLAQTFAARR
jgi:diaminohydroxyphosphoribosylaminopyrimidine deaminase/5-amino-6-(5-phosphoribosylamino)uracil reductase